MASILVTAQDREIEELIGPDRVSVVEAHLRQNAKNIEHRTESLIARAAQRLAQHRAGTLPAKIQLEWQSNPDLTAGLSYSEAATCPACGSTGTLEGDDGSDRSYNYEVEDDGCDPGWAWATITVSADYFSCPNCHLVLDRYELIEQADLPTTFEVIDDEPAEEPEYGND